MLGGLWDPEDGLDVVAAFDGDLAYEGLEQAVLGFDGAGADGALDFGAELVELLGTGGGEGRGFDAGVELVSAFSEGRRSWR